MKFKVLTGYIKIKNISSLLQFILNICLIGMSIVLSALLIYETWSLFHILFFNSENPESYYQFTDELLVFFLYFEFLALIIKYFESKFHFPLRYFIYIGITAIVRLIIIDHENAMHTFWWSLAILVLIAALLLLNINTKYKKSDY